MTDTGSIQLCQITGVLRDHHGQPLPKTALKIISRLVTSAGGSVRAPRATEVLSDGDGMVSFGLLPGPYLCHLQRGRTWDDFEIFVADDVQQIELQDLLAQLPVLTPPLVAEARRYRDEARQYLHEITALLNGNGLPAGPTVTFGEGQIILTNLDGVSPPTVSLGTGQIILGV